MLLEPGVDLLAGALLGSNWLPLRPQGQVAPRRALQVRVIAADGGSDLTAGGDDSTRLLIRQVIGVVTVRGIAPRGRASWEPLTRERAATGSGAGGRCLSAPRGWLEESFLLHQNLPAE